MLNDYFARPSRSRLGALDREVVRRGAPKRLITNIFSGRRQGDLFDGPVAISPCSSMGSFVTNSDLVEVPARLGIYALMRHGCGMRADRLVKQIGKRCRN